MADVKIRGHHVVCLAYFNGKGYSQSFIENMREVLNRIGKNPDIEIELISSCDDICRECIFINSEKCLAEDKVREMDRVAFNKLNLKENYIIKAVDFFNLEKSLSIKDRDSICEGCGWKKACFLNKRTA